ncbi:methyl-accepting chemotaxis protein [Aeromonas salmonicida]|uniref:methyl-accepting chemotaxis protein n=1 Tax=Aeromonas salmonicida TaxID=645 RepID=UPI002796E188|nr:methyl-accepting chemotaxis protein [Aeromonas salmonicida]MDQ1886575.1 methyl-accepting chemotaxis protein [Aeromonas salmonicida]
MNLSIKNKLILVIGIIILVITGLQAWYNTVLLREQTRKLVWESVDIASVSYVHGIARWLDSRASMVSSVKEAFVLEDEPISYMLQAEKAGGFDLVYVGTEDGKMIQSHPTALPAGYDPRQRPWYQDANSTGKLVITSPYVDAANSRLVTTIAQPFQRGNAKGVIAGDITIDDLVSDILAIELEGTYTMLLDSNGTIIAHPNKDLVRKQSTELFPELTSTKIKEYGNNGTISERMVSGKSSVFDLTPIPNTNWYYGIVVDKAIAYQSVDHMITSAIWQGCLTLIIVATLSYLAISNFLLPLNTLGATIADLSRGHGDLTNRINIERKDEVGAVASHVNLFIDRIHEMVQDIAHSAQHLNQQAISSHKMVEQSNHELGRQQNDITQIATAVHEMSATASDVANHAEQTAEAARTSAGSCEEGKQVIVRNQHSITHLATQVEHASCIILDLEKNTQEINAILSTIQGIAEQTNLLALNAAIEAARAGEQGRGFAVVADEVRSLSGRTHHATIEIRNMIETLQLNTRSAVGTMQESKVLAQHSVDDASNATQALEQITLSIEHIFNMATQIASAAEEQRAVTDEVSRNIQAVKDVSDVLAEQAQQSNLLTNQLQSITGELNNQVGMFHI